MKLSASAILRSRNLIDLFGRAFDLAQSHLDGIALAELVQRRTQPLASLQWVPAPVLSSVQDWVQRTLARDVPHPEKIVAQQAGVLVEILGEGQIDAKAFFVLAACIDAELGPRFAAEDRPVSESGGVTVAPQVFYSGVKNPAPALGQMTPSAICLAWMKYLRPLPTAKELKGIGRVPSIRGRKLLGGAKLRLQEAVESERELRIGCVGWRRHDPAQLIIARRSGLFAVTGLAGEADAPALVRDLLDEVARTRAHIVVLPELALDDGQLALLKAELASRERQLPVLTVAGLVHRASGSAYVNEAVVLDANGEELLRHEKLEPFTARDGAMEDIVPRQSAEYRFLDTPVGRLVVNICRDVASDIPMLLNRALGASILCVPAYSNELAFAANEGHVLGARQRCITVAVNPATQSVRGAAMGYAPVVTPQDQKGKAPSQVRDARRPAYGTASLVQADWGTDPEAPEAPFLLFSFIRGEDGIGRFLPPTGEVTAASPR